MHKEFFYLGVKSWNVLSAPLRDCKSVKEFSQLYKKLLLLSITTDENYMVNNTFDYVYELPAK